MEKFFDDPVLDKFYEKHAPEFRLMMRKMHGYPVEKKVLATLNETGEGAREVLAEQPMNRASSLIA